MPSASVAMSHLLLLPLLLLLLTVGVSARPSTEAALGESSGGHSDGRVAALTADAAHPAQVAALAPLEEGAGAGDGPAPDSDDADVDAADQQFFPSFAPLFQPLGHSRPQLLFQEPAHSQRLRAQHNSFLGYHHQPQHHQHQQQPPSAFGAGYLRGTATGPASGPGAGIGGGGGAGPTAAAAAVAPASNLLGSGNFGVIRGGTFYNDDDRGVFGGGSGDAGLLGASYYSNGHGRPSYYNPRPQPHHHDFFANFRDFADINTPTKSSYSQYVVVYANKNATGGFSAGRPKNIIEQLELLDSEPVSTSTPSPLSTGAPPPHKMKKKPLKPAKTKGTVQRRVDKESKPGRKKVPAEAPSYQKDTYEPLLALS